MSQQLRDPANTRIDYLGVSPEAGPLPAFFYFALSGEESLALHPYCQPPQLLTASSSIRVFSFTIPGHGPELNKFEAMKYWADAMLKGDYLLETFFETVVQAIQWLIDQKIAHPAALAVGGLSRGGFVATHIAARMAQIETVLGFAPLTELMLLKEFADHPELKRRASSLDLTHLVDRLTHVKNFRFYIGNLDTRVGTDACYHFIRKLAETGHAKHARHQKVELMITHSLGHKGHGTDPKIFEEGTTWLKQHLTSAKGLP